MANRTYDVAAYIWPSYTGDELRSRIFWPEGIGEWQTVQHAQPKFKGHAWPRKPVWGYVNEADRYVMEMQIAAAADHGVNVFIYDWYWYDNRPFLENCLNDGFLQASNRSRMKFYLMWANHDVNHLWDVRTSSSDCFQTVIWNGFVNREQFETIAHRVIDKYFHLPEYYTIDGKPVFSIYYLANLIKGLGDVPETRKALDWFREECVRAGLPGLHLQVVTSGKNKVYADQEHDTQPPFGPVLKELGFDSVTYYQYCSFCDLSRGYHQVALDARDAWLEREKSYGLTLVPHVSVGWDTNPRYQALKPNILNGNTPEEIKLALQYAKEFLDARPNQVPLLTINSWNEWTEGSYLEPDDLYGYQYRQAIKDTFLPNA